jgi:hypothetical protein
MGMLAAELTQMEKALRRIAKISEGAALNITNRELRFYELALEGLGKAPAEREHLVRAMIQRRRDRQQVHRERSGDANETA